MKIDLFGRRFGVTKEFSVCRPGNLLICFGGKISPEMRERDFEVKKLLEIENSQARENWSRFKTLVRESRKALKAMPDGDEKDQARLRLNTMVREAVCCSLLSQERKRFAERLCLRVLNLQLVKEEGLFLSNEQLREELYA